MEEELENRIIERYAKIESIRAVSRQIGLSREKIREVLVEKGVKILTNDEALIISNRKTLRKSFEGDEQDKAYLYGFVLGDVHVFKKSKFTLRAVTNSTHKSFVDLFVSELSKYGKVNYRYVLNKKEWAMFIDLDYQSFHFLEERKENHLPGWIDDRNFISFLSGFIDSDGSVIIKRAGKYFQLVIRLFGQGICVLQQINNHLHKMGFRPSLTRTFKAGRVRFWKGKKMIYNKDYFTLEIYRKEETIKLLKLLSIKHEEKIKRREQIFKIYGTGEFLWTCVKEQVIKLREKIESEVQEQKALAAQHPSRSRWV